MEFYVLGSVLMALYIFFIIFTALHVDITFILNLQK